MLVEEIEMLRGQMQEITAREEAMLAGLATTLQDAEQRLLMHVREIAERHNARRLELIEELRALATGFGAPMPRRETDHGLDAVTAHPQVTYDASVVAMPMTGGGASWREATRMIADEEDAGLGALLRANAR